MLPSTERKATILPNREHSLVSIGSLCNSGCTVMFKIKYFTVMYKNIQSYKGGETTRKIVVFSTINWYWIQASVQQQK